MTCLACGVEIPAARLAAMPLTEFCLDCKAAQEADDEKRGRIRAHHIPEAIAESEIDPSEVYGR